MNPGAAATPLDRRRKRAVSEMLRRKSAAPSHRCPWRVSFRALIGGDHFRTDPPRFRRLATALVAGVSLIAPAFQVSAADEEPTTFWKRIEEKGLCARVLETLPFYENEENSFIQAASVVGRYHGQYWSVNADQRGADGWEHRRNYLGAEATLFRHFTLQAQIKISEDFNPFYEGRYPAFVEWTPNEAVALSLGREDFLFNGLERSISSTKIPPFERGLLVNQVMPGEVVGALVEGKPGNFSSRAGIFSGSIEEEFTEFNGGAAWSLGWATSCHCFTNPAASTWIICSTTAIPRTKPWSHTIRCSRFGTREKPDRSAWAWT